jgi:hypothetical protein
MQIVDISRFIGDEVGKAKFPGVYKDKITKLKISKLRLAERNLI